MSTIGPDRTPLIQSGSIDSGKSSKKVEEHLMSPGDKKIDDVVKKRFELRPGASVALKNIKDKGPSIEIIDKTGQIQHVNMKSLMKVTGLNFLQILWKKYTGELNQGSLARLAEVNNPQLQLLDKLKEREKNIELLKDCGKLDKDDPMFELGSTTEISQMMTQYVTDLAREKNAEFSRLTSHESKLDCLVKWDEAIVKKMYEASGKGEDLDTKLIDRLFVVSMMKAGNPDLLSYIQNNQELLDPQGAVAQSVIYDIVETVVKNHPEQLVNKDALLDRTEEKVGSAVTRFSRAINEMQNLQSEIKEKEAPFTQLGAQKANELNSSRSIKDPYSPLALPFLINWEKEVKALLLKENNNIPPSDEAVKKALSASIQEALKHSDKPLSRLITTLTSSSHAYTVGSLQNNGNRLLIPSDSMRIFVRAEEDRRVAANEPRRETREVEEDICNMLLRFHDALPLERQDKDIR